MNKDDIIKKFSMAKHIEGGYFCETYRSDEVVDTDRQNRRRFLLTSIYYLLTDDRPIGYFHRNKSDIVHYFHAGHALTYLIIDTCGRLTTVKLGNDIMANEHPQLVVRGGCWKATLLEKGEFGLLSEAVAPGFEYSDMEIATAEQIRRLVRGSWDELSRFVKSS